MIKTIPIRFAAFIPCMFCAALCLMAAFSDAGKPAFYSFLPMCFFFIGVVIVRQQREIERLTKKPQS